MLRNEVTIEADVLVIGGGFAGCQAALRAKDFVDNVVLVDKAVVSRSGASAYAHTHFAPWDLTDSEIEEWIRELVEKGSFLVDQKWAELFLREAPHRISQLQEWGIPYERNNDGRLLYVLTRGHETPKSLSVDGRTVQEKLKEKMLAKGVRLVERVMITDLLTADGQQPTRDRVVGAIGIHCQNGAFYEFRAKAVVLATGPTFPKMKFCYCDHMTGEGLVMAFRAGAEITGMEFAVFSQFSYWERRFFTPGQAKMQGFGARIINSLGERIMERHNPEGLELLASLTHISAAVAAENLDGRGPCYFDMRHFSARAWESMRVAAPAAMKAFDEFGIDPGKEIIETNPLVGVGSEPNAGGGPVVDLECRSSIPGLFVAGAATHSPCMIAGQSASIPSTFAHVSGYRAGEFAAREARQVRRLAVVPGQVAWLKEKRYRPLARRSQVKPYDVIYAINSRVNRAENIIFKSKARILRVLDYLRQVENELLPQVSAPDAHELVKATEAESLVTIAKLHFLAALEREESRDPHYRTDFLFSDNKDWLKWLILSNSNGEVKVVSRPVPVQDYPLQPRVTRVNIPLQIPASLLEGAS